MIVLFQEIPLKFKILPFGIIMKIAMYELGIDSDDPEF